MIPRQRLRRAAEIAWGVAVALGGSVSRAWCDAQVDHPEEAERAFWEAQARAQEREQIRSPRGGLR